MDGKNRWRLVEKHAKLLLMGGVSISQLKSLITPLLANILNYAVITCGFCFSLSVFIRKAIANPIALIIAAAMKA